MMLHHALIPLIPQQSLQLNNYHQHINDSFLISLLDAQLLWQLQPKPLILIISHPPILNLIIFAIFSMITNLKISSHWHTQYLLEQFGQRHHANSIPSWEETMAAHLHCVQKTTWMVFHLSLPNNSSRCKNPRRFILDPLLYVLQFFNKAVLQPKNNLLTPLIGVNHSTSSSFTMLMPFGCYTSLPMGTWLVRNLGHCCHIRQDQILSRSMQSEYPSRLPGQTPPWWILHQRSHCRIFLKTRCSHYWHYSTMGLTILIVESGLQSLEKPPSQKNHP